MKTKLAEFIQDLKHLYDWWREEYTRDENGRTCDA